MKEKLEELKKELEKQRNDLRTKKVEVAFSEKKISELEKDIKTLEKRLDDRFETLQKMSPDLLFEHTHQYGRTIIKVLGIEGNQVCHKVVWNSSSAKGTELDFTAFAKNSLKEFMYYNTLLESFKPISNNDFINEILNEEFEHIKKFCEDERF